MRVPLFRWQHRLHWWTGADDDFLGILLTVLLLGATAFFVGSEFALISARRDRLEALAEQGKHSAVTVIRAGENLSLMLAGAQLGITVYSILLGRIGEPAVAHLLEKPFYVLGIPETLLHTVSFVIAIKFVVVLHVLLGEMVSKNIAIAGPESTAMRLIPAYLIWMRVARPLIAFYNRCANITLRAMGVQVKDELDVTVSTVELSEMIAESRSEGLLDPEEHLRLTRAADPRPRRRRRCGAAGRDPRGAGRSGGQRTDGLGDRARPGRDRLFTVPDHRPVRSFHRIPAHQGRAAAHRRPRRRRRPLGGAAAAGGA